MGARAVELNKSKQTGMIFFPSIKITVLNRGVSFYNEDIASINKVNRKKIKKKQPSRFLSTRGVSSFVCCQLVASVAATDRAFFFAEFFWLSFFVFLSSSEI